VRPKSAAGLVRQLLIHEYVTGVEKKAKADKSGVEAGVAAVGRQEGVTSEEKQEMGAPSYLVDSASLYQQSKDFRAFPRWLVRAAWPHLRSKSQKRIRGTLFTVFKAARKALTKRLGDFKGRSAEEIPEARCAPQFCKQKTAQTLC
jgi:hypothetical protein